MPTPRCARCGDPKGVAIYDSRGFRMPLCRYCAKDHHSPVVEAPDLAAVARSGICWCHLESTGLHILWCPHLHNE
jgi:hypothetical protein